MPGVSAIYKCGATYGEIHITTLYRTKRLGEFAKGPVQLPPVGLLSAGESVEELDWI
jgi:hypothetical protein